MSKLAPGKKIYFASDFHLGLKPDEAIDHSREKIICQWLESCMEDADTIFLVGDLFDTWFDYKKAVPRGFTRFLGTMARIADKGINIEIFSGNHDFWMTDYFEQEWKAKVHHHEQEYNFNDQLFFVAHGDGLGPGDKTYKRLKKLLNNPLAQYLYKGLHPNLGIRLAQYFSRRGDKHVGLEQVFQGEDKEALVLFSKEKIKEKPFHYFIFGHRHLMLDIPIAERCRYINLGDWISYYSYAVFDGKDLQLLQFKPKENYR